MTYSTLKFALLLTVLATAEAAESQPIPQQVQALLNKHCVECHNEDEKTREGNVNLAVLSTGDLKSRLELLNKAQEQLHFAMMPPPESVQPSAEDRQALSGWVRGELVKLNAPLIEDRLRYPDYGNAVDHDKLFSGTIKDKPFTPTRRWLVSPQIFQERVLSVFRDDPNTRRQAQQALYGVTNPFVLPDRSGIRDYAITPLDGGHLLVMLTNADWISKKQIHAARIKKGEIKAGEFENPKDRWYPITPTQFEAVILTSEKPDETALVNAIQKQFGLVLERPATAAEVTKYLTFTRAAIDLAGNTEGLRQMLNAVLLESDFLYRLEFGAGAPDEHGRKPLAPIEAAFAISYALGDRNPAPELLKAAAEDRLNTHADYEREVNRLLDDKSYYQGPIDPIINNSTVVSHPKIIRFFREFFGYSNALKVFKDKNRSGGYYENPGRGSSATPGHLIREADRVVDLALQRDQNVFVNLLTTDEFFMYHNLDNETGSKQIAQWRELYETLKDTDWRNNPDKVAADFPDILKQNRIEPVSKRQSVHGSTLTRVMTHFSYTFGKGNTPFTTFPWAHGNQFRYSQSYNMPITPGLDGKYGGNDNLDYPVVQPFKAPHRKGILTHPAWLIAHSSNFHTDPIRRGRWVQEKLLAGRVPDVPITVDAKVPEDPHKTLRERVEGVTGVAQTACWKCHQQMNPLGYPFEFFDDFGRYRTEEPLENPENLLAKAKGKYDADTYKTKTVVTTGYLKGTGDPKLDGEVRDAYDLIDRLAQSERVRQSIIRHAFRFYMGRNELLSDSATLIAADQAYIKSGGSFRAVIVSLLTSDSFRYRK